MGSPFKRKNGGEEQLSIDEILGSIKKEAGAPAAGKTSFLSDFDSRYDDDFDDDFDSPNGGDFGFAPPPAPQPAAPEAPAGGRRHFGRGKPAQPDMPADFGFAPPPAPQAAAQAQPEPPAAGRRHFGRGKSAQPAPPEEFGGAQQGEIFDDFELQPPVGAQMPPIGGPLPPQMPQQRPAPAVKAVTEKPAEVMSVEAEGSLFDRLKAKLSGKQQEDDGVVYYTPPEGYAPKRVRYRRHNHRPFPMWAKSAVLAALLLFTIFSIVKLTYYGMMIGRTNFVDSSQHASVRLTLDESEAMQAQLTEEDENDVTLPGLALRSNENIRTILLVGTSSSVGTGNAGECDSIVLVAIDNEHNKIKLVSIARDLYAYIPDYHNNKIGEAYFYDSASGNRTLAVLRDVVEQNLCVKIDNVVMIDYDALQVIVNKLGGIKLAVSDEEALYMSTDEKYGSFPRYNAGGVYTMTGNEALNYIRMKNIGEKTDVERVERLRNVLMTMAQDIGERSAVKRAAAIYSVLPYVTTDMNSRQIYDIVKHARRYLIKYEICGYSLPVAGTWDFDKVEINGRNRKVVVASYSFNAEYLQKFIYDDDLTYTYGNSATGVDVPYISEEAKAAALAEAEAVG